ncbi:DUF1775 domain-containing protein [Methylobacterium nodulans]|uniref:YncI copper-binding domain-containing protein n=1 Tax=Methylobacterium nodulans (strain LMG 21967 / CNCM I-2342 / ORS 2060) TaxID=460265 RepID=B8ILE7_METNO|nr:DUF1775 domain-containing protein [Methylobacterium nodulans]ACL60146.1 protein of unknown function DUF461 [Methylobacterium nodulans ORS 2060]
MIRFLSGGLCAALVASSASALAHAVLERGEASPNRSYRAVIQISHGCDGKPTTRVTVTVPEGVIGAKPMPKPGWTLTTVTGPYARAYPSYRGEIREGVKEITWSGGSLPDDHFDEFTVQTRISDAFASGETVYFPVRQDCSEGSLAWTEIPAAGQSAHDLKSPAPGVRIVAAGVPAAPAAATRAGDLTIETPWMRATPGGAKVAGGYLRVTNTGTAPDRLLGASIPLAGRGEVHEMSMNGGVMRMAPVEGGLTIKPGETVELKPGGYHLMFLDLKSPVKAGETVEGTLTFERAGSVPVRFQVGAIGAAGPGGGGHQHQH